LSLFRPEVQQAQSAQWLGVVRISHPIRYTVVAGVALVLGGLLVAFAAWGEVTRKVRVTGVLMPTGGSLNISAPQSGVIAERRVAEGQTIAAGAVLLVLNTERQSVQGSGVGDTSAQVAEQITARQHSLDQERSLRQLLTQQRSEVLTDRLRTLDAQLRQAADEITLLERRVALSQTSVQRYQQLAAEGFMADIQVQGKLEDQLDARGRLQSLERTRLALQQDRQTLAGEQQTLKAQLDTDEAQLARSQSSLRQEASENAARQTAVVTAPSSVGTPGTRYRVTALNLQPGQAVQAGQTVATLVPEQTDADTPSVEAQLYAPSRTAGFVQAGQSVYLRYAAYPYQKFGLHTGRITSVSATPFAANELPPNLAQQLMAQAGSTEALYRIRVQLDDQAITSHGQSYALKAGLSLEADVLQERRKVWEWVLEPLLAARAQLKVLGADSQLLIGK
jgi:membrane fusion protein